MKTDAPWQLIRVTILPVTSGHGDKMIAGWLMGYMDIRDSSDEYGSQLYAVVASDEDPPFILSYYHRSRIRFATEGTEEK